MAIADALQELATDISAAYNKIDDKGGTLPDNKNTYNLVNAIDSILTGATPTGTISITQNETVDVTDYAEADVNVVDDSINKLLNGTLVEYRNDIVTTVRAYAFYGLTSLQKIELPNWVNTQFNTGYTFYGCTGLKQAIFPKLIAKRSYGSQMFRNCSNLMFLSLPESIGIPQHCCTSCTKLQTAVLSKCGNSDAQSGFNANAFNGCSVLKNLILPLKCSIEGTSLTGTPFVSGGSGGTVYTNYANKTWYTTASIWSNYYNGGTLAVKSIQESLTELQQIGYNSTTGEYDYHIDLTPYYEIVEELPTESISTTKVYLIETATTGTYEQHYYNGTNWLTDLPDITL